MTAINQLSAMSSLTLGDLMVVFSTTNGDARKAALSVLLELIQENLASSADKVTQYSAPTATAFSVQVTDGADSIWLILTPNADYAAGTIVLPALANCVDAQEILVNCTRAVTALTINGNGATVVGAPTALVANDFFRLRFDAVLDTWYRVG
jgi:hypothetical protein